MAVATLVLSGCIHNIRAFRFSTNPIKAKQQILEKVPLGTSLDVAHRKMINMGFHCELRKEKVFPKTATTGSDSQKFYEKQYLVCTQERIVTMISHWQWVVDLDIDQLQSVTNVVVSVGKRYL